MIAVRRVFGLLTITAALFGGQVVNASAATTVTIAPDNPGATNNCYPFGIASGWTPFAGYVYRNLPAFNLKTGDILAFDLGAVNDADIQLRIDLAPTTVNGGDVPSGAFTTIATNAQTPASPRGDTIAGNYELRWLAEAPFSFGGGGLIIRFSNPSATYALDTTCTGVITQAAVSSDTSDLFLERFYNDAEGTAPWNATSAESLAPFRLILADPADVTRPQTRIKALKIKGARAKFRFVSSEPGSRFQCKLDKRPFKRCTSPKVYKRLADGGHKFKVRAIDACGNVDRSPAGKTFKI